MDRKKFAEMHAKLMALRKPHEAALAALGDLESDLEEGLGLGAVATWCDVCGMPLFEGDRYASDATGDVTVCERMANEANSNDPSLPCYDPDRS